MAKVKRLQSGWRREGRMEYIKHRPWIFFLLLAIAALLLSLCPKLHDTGSVLSEILIALVIYNEIEESRIAAFLNAATGKAYKDRQKVYEAFMEMQGETVHVKATAFVKHVWADPKLRGKCDYQLTYFSQAHFLVRGSFFSSNLISDWFPQVVVRVWAMLHAYAIDSERLAIRAGHELALEVVKSVDALRRQKIDTLAIHSKTGNKCMITAAEMDSLRELAVDYLEKGVKWGGSATNPQ